MADKLKGVRWVCEEYNLVRFEDWFTPDEAELAIDFIANMRKKTESVAERAARMYDYRSR